MKKVIFSLLCFCTCNATHGQIVKPGEVAKEAGTNTVNGDIRSGINNTADKANNELKSLFKKKKKTEEPKAAEPRPTAKPKEVEGAAPVTPPQARGSFKSYSNYDFVPGDRIVFEDNFADDQDGEFPAHWNLGRGQAVLNKIGGREALLITDGNFAM